MSKVTPHFPTKHSENVFNCSNDVIRDACIYSFKCYFNFFYFLRFLYIFQRKNLAFYPLNYNTKSKLEFYVPFNSQGHIGTGPQNCHLWDSNPQR